VNSNYVNSNYVNSNYVMIGSSDWNYSICCSTGFVVAATGFVVAAIGFVVAAIGALSLLWAATEA
jgi:hypothetical protein